MQGTMTSLDHLVLTVADIGTSVEFYTTALGMQHMVTPQGRHSLHFGMAKINLHQQDLLFQPHASHPVPGSADLCFLTDTPVQTMIDQLRTCRVEIIEGPVKRSGAAGELISIYFRDPDGNLLEVANVTPSTSSDSTSLQEKNHAA